VSIEPFIGRVGRGPRLPWLGDAQIEVVLPATASAGRQSVVAIFAGRGYSATEHVHSREDETFYVVTGAITVWVDGRPGELGPGGLALLPKGLPHRYRVDADDTQILNICHPGGLDGFFREIAGRLDADDLATVLPQTGERYGVTYLG
jgi:mannose-6-phosphate isomerase-like protein (cupin superfamily)